MLVGHRPNLRVWNSTSLLGKHVPGVTPFVMMMVQVLNGRCMFLVQDIVDVLSRAGEFWHIICADVMSWGSRLLSRSEWPISLPNVRCVAWQRFFLHRPASYRCAWWWCWSKN